MSELYVRYHGIAQQERKTGDEMMDSINMTRERRLSGEEVQDWAAWTMKVTGNATRQAHIKVGRESRDTHEEEDSVIFFTKSMKPFRVYRTLLDAQGFFRGRSRPVRQANYPNDTGE